jgi:hypothetical protein
MDINSIDYSKIEISNIKKFLTNDGHFCYIKYNNDKLYVELPVSTVTFNVDLNKDKNILSLNLNKNNESLSTFNENIKQMAINRVYDKNVYNYTPTTVLNEFYCNPHKIAKNGKKYEDVLKLKILKNKLRCDVSELPHGCKIKTVIDVFGLWFSNNSFGPYYTVVDIEIIETLQKKINKPEFIESEENDIDLSNCCLLK